MEADDDAIEGRITEVIDRGSDFHVRYRENGEGDINGVVTLPKNKLCGALSEAHDGRRIKVTLDEVNTVRQVDVGSRRPGINHTGLRR